MSKFKIRLKALKIGDTFTCGEHSVLCVVTGDAWKCDLDNKYKMPCKEVKLNHLTYDIPYMNFVFVEEHEAVKPRINIKDMIKMKFEEHDRAFEDCDTQLEKAILDQLAVMSVEHPDIYKEVWKDH